MTATLDDLRAIRECERRRQRDAERATSRKCDDCPWHRTGPCLNCPLMEYDPIGHGREEE